MGLAGKCKHKCMDGAAGEAAAMGLVNTILLASCCGVLEGSWFLSAAAWIQSVSSVSLELGGVLSHLNGKPHGRAASPGVCEGLRPLG